MKQVNQSAVNSIQKHSPTFSSLFPIYLAILFKTWILETKIRFSIFLHSYLWKQLQVNSYFKWCKKWMLNWFHCSVAMWYEVSHNYSRYHLARNSLWLDSFHNPYEECLWLGILMVAKLFKKKKKKNEIFILIRVVHWISKNSKVLPLDKLNCIL